MSKSQLMLLVEERFTEIADKANARYAARIEALNNAWSEANEKLRPNQDRLGRLHSPCDGYSLPQHVDFHPDIDCEQLYRKGEFLPTPLAIDETDAHFQVKRSNELKNRFVSKDKIKVELKLAEEMVEHLDGNNFITISHGKSWNVDGINLCYLYLTAISESFFNDFVKSIKESIASDFTHNYTGSAYEGRQTVKGKIVKVNDSFNYYSKYPTEKAFIILDNDSTCYGTLPAGFNVGDTVQFTATFTKSDKEHHAFYKRPSKMVSV